MPKFVDFSQEFYIRYDEIQKEIAAAEEIDQLQLLAENINLLKDWISDKAEQSKVPSYNLKEYSKSIKDLILQYELKKSSFMPKSFKFKHRPVSDLADKRVVLNEQQEVLNTAMRSFAVPTLSNITDKFLYLESGAGNVYFKGLRSCTVDISPSRSVSSITLEDCEYTIFRLHSEAFIFLTNINNCLLKASCQQLRVHDTHQTFLDVSIETDTNHIVIENSDQLQIVESGSNFTVDDFNRPNQDTDSDSNYKLVSCQKYEHTIADYYQNLRQGLPYSSSHTVDLIDMVKN
ncbi:hypothetical protein FOA43_004001 [Brettanomyces nanus]|uniref:C-CAP/cofactor C-like domain-containing protein n=1 Tax=Eeniella nana TaxID=13502 RepID=A0A875SAL0_EENNA|nr:uncharacterized protein FOA43_004001 [Brettanomyces nanus]QPG76609.1 hypothetical protein FOA43_004001 [Brettanomyces nanus]